MGSYFLLFTFLSSLLQALFAAINANSGGAFDVSMYTLSHFLGILRVEVSKKYGNGLKNKLKRDDFNLTMPSWISDEFYSNLMQAVDEGEDFSVGQGMESDL